MPKYIAFLRAINVGSHVVKMDQLRALFIELGLENVETFIASGNVIFDSRSLAKSLEPRIEKHLKQSLGYEVKTFLRSTSELAAINQYRSFGEEELNAEGNTLYVGFLAVPPSESAKQLLISKSSPIDGFHVNDRELYWLYRSNNGDSKFYGGLLEKTLGMPATLRNFNTVQRLAKKYCV
jgi:uncharacterized protein (DUF1697 family)